MKRNTNTSWCPIERATEIIGDQWSLLILRELSSGPLRFKLLKENLPQISMDQLSRKLEHLCLKEMIVRQEFSESPPRVEYQLTDRGVSFVPVLKRILNWSTQNIWNGPQEDEVVDPAQSLRMMASLAGQGEGIILIRILGEVGFGSEAGTRTGARDFLVHRNHEGRVKVVEGSELKRVNSFIPDAEVQISLDQWIKLLASENLSYAQVKAQVRGDIALLRRVLPVFSMPKSDDRPNDGGRGDAVHGEGSIRAIL